MNFINWLKAQGDRAAGWAGIAIGGVLILAGWITTSGTRVVSDQIPYLVSAGLGGLFFVAVGVALLVRADLHDEWSKLDSLEHALRTRTGSGEDRVVELRDQLSAPEAGVEAASPGPRRAEPVLAVSLGRDGTAAPLALRQEAGSLVVALAGGLVLLWGWVSVSGTRHVPTAIEDSALAVAGLTIAAAAVALNSFGLRRRVARRMARLFGSVPAGSMVSAGVNLAEVGDSRLYVVDGSTRYHRSNCRVLTTQAPAAVHPATTTAGLTACRLCEAGVG